MNLSNSPLVRGALAGAIATLPMTMAMAKMFENLPARDRTRPLPPGEITARIEDEAGVTDRLTKRQHRDLSIASHFGFGAFCGALYALTFNRLRTRTPVKGAAFGIAVWGISYLGWLPALGLFPGAWHESKERNGMMVGAHLVWGVSLARLMLQDTRELIKGALTGIMTPTKTRLWVGESLT